MQRVLRRDARLWWLGALVVGALIAVFAELKAQQVPSEDALVLAADGALTEAMRAGDKSVARKLLSLEFSFVDENGSVRERRDFLADLKAAAATPDTDAKVKIYGLVAMVTGHHKSAQGSDTFFLDIWVKQKRAWRALTMQEVVLAAEDTQPAVAAAPAAPGADAKPYECKNPCQAIPYRIRSLAEQDIVTAFQTIEKAVVARDAGEWSRHIADEFVLYGSGRAPTSKPDGVAAIEKQNESNAHVTVTEVESMRLSVYGDGAAMTSSHVASDNARPPYRAARVWVRRNGQWQMAISVQTAVKSP